MIVWENEILNSLWLKTTNSSSSHYQIIWITGIIKYVRTFLCFLYCGSNGRQTRMRIKSVEHANRRRKKKTNRQTRETKIDKVFFMNRCDLAMVQRPTFCWKVSIWWIKTVKRFYGSSMIAASWLFCIAAGKFVS